MSFRTSTACTKDGDLGAHFSMFFPKAGSNELIFFGTMRHVVINDEIPKMSTDSTPKFRKQLRKFPTGSTHIGEWNYLGFSGDGTYTYTHGVIYKGNFNKHGMFHGVGTLIYPGGQKLEGIWKNGQLTEGSSYTFSCGEALNENFKYCQMPDRRFNIEIENYFGPAKHEYLTNDQEPKKIPDCCYDTVEGFYNPRYNFITYPVTSIKREEKEPLIRAASTDIIESCRRKMSEECIINGHYIMEISTLEKEKWIKTHCRKAWDEPTGYRPDLYETWSAGRKDDIYPTEYNESLISCQCNNNVIKVKSKMYSFIKKNTRKEC